MAEPRSGFTENDLRRMLGALARRGPDGEGVWCEDGAFWGHRRLSVIDLSAQGDQPMVSADGRWVLVTNGEIYNYKELRQALDREKRIAWRGESDTEVMLEVLAHWGVEAGVKQLTGMFAFAVWDRRDRRVWLGRDRFGEKPLCYHLGPGGLYFASEVRALETAPGVSRDLDPDALSLYLQYGYTPAPLSIYRDIRKLPPASLLSWRPGEAPVVEPYWRLSTVMAAGRRDLIQDEDAALTALDAVLREVVQSQMVADVPLGVFLSGGVDSSLVAALMTAAGPGPIQTFTLGFDAPEFNEADHARAVAAHLGTQHTEYIATGADALNLTSGLGGLTDEPFADASLIPTLMVSELARRKVTVALSGDGGDEMFAGYVRYPGVRRLWRTFGGMPMRGVIAGTLRAAPLSWLDIGFGAFGAISKTYAGRSEIAAGVRKVAAWMDAPSREAMFERTVSGWINPERVLNSAAPRRLAWRPDPPAGASDLDWMQWRDAVDYLPGDILCKVDRAAMHHSLETRAPFLDHRVADLAWRLPESLKLAGDETKVITKRLLRRYVPSALIDRPKVGFSIPLRAWLTGPLRDWAQSLISPDRLSRQGLLRPAPIMTAWKALEGGDSSVAQGLWTVLMLQAWLDAR